MRRRRGAETAQQLAQSKAPGAETAQQLAQSKAPGAETALHLAQSDAPGAERRCSWLSPAATDKKMFDIS